MLTSIFLPLIGGLILFLYALNYLSSNLKAFSDGKLRYYLDKFTGNLFSGIASGIVLTILLDSSSAVIIMTIALVKARVLTFRQAMGIVMGANIGTTIASEILALDIGKYSSILMFIGFLMSLQSYDKIQKNIGRVVLGIGLIFFGLYIIELALEPLTQNPNFHEWMTDLEHPLAGVAVGAVVTLLTQSSSATMGMALSLGAKNLISLYGALAVMLGTELGTCSDTLLASIGKSRQALKTGLFHLTFNVLSIIMGLLLFQPFVHLVRYISSNASLERQIANGFVLFNCLGVLFFIPFVSLLEKGLNKLLPEKQP